MFDFLSAHAATILISAALALLLYLAARSVRKTQGQGACGSCSGCSACAHAQDTCGYSQSEQQD